ncbi:Pyridoxamine 5'-phosphate oxidase [Gemmobacter aquatilis]|uniref:Pyridoxamine 5'-phosphate oxidase n=1 Tax=Gemmobacter aquatilis TaxID=933059 RepID=A0A1H7Z2G4_9RHOB|nr:pyridoxamine 5'-phosphate oxidase family protein [Gemmobacter aquatilis]SEM52516.1 Pyridoxamine 5'-phosphate oxidase [Gemmobacter aquatilis]
MRIDDTIATFISGQVMIGLATVDWTGQASIARSVGARVGEGGATIDLLISATQWRNAVENLAANGALAVTFSSPADYVTYQIKGQATVAGAGADEMALAQGYVAGMRDRLAALGVPPDVSAQWFCVEDLQIVRLRPSLVFVQTPGPRAGEAIAT